MTDLWTLGFDGRTPEKLVAILKDYEIDRVVDVRELPLSDQRGFSKGPLSATIGEAGIQYDLRRELGAPRPLRDALAQGGDVEDFVLAYKAHVPERAVRELAQAAIGERVCILSEARDPDRSTRRALGDALEQKGLHVHHIV